MTTIFIIHGSNASPDAHWFPYLDQELKKKGAEVIRLQFPVREKQSLSNWLKTLQPYQAKLDDAIMVGHSLGVPFILQVIQHFKPKLRAVFLVAGFVGFLEVEGEDNLNDFSNKLFQWKLIKQQCRHITVIHAKDDPIVPFSRAKELAHHVGVNVSFISINKGGHLCAGDGFNTFPLLRDLIVKEL